MTETSSVRGSTSGPFFHASKDLPPNILAMLAHSCEFMGESALIPPLQAAHTPRQLPAPRSKKARPSLDPNTVRTAECDAICREFIAQWPHAFYEEKVFLEVCKDFNCESEGRIWAASLNEKSSLEDIVNAVKPKTMRLHFICSYIAALGS